MSVRGKLKSAAGYVGSSALGSAVGYGLAKYSEITANANVAVRPELAKVDFWTAFYADHASDWLFYHMPDTMEKYFIVGGLLLFPLILAGAKRAFD